MVEKGLSEGSLESGEPRPNGLGQSLQWEANLKRMILNINPMPGPLPNKEEVAIWKIELMTQ